MKLVLGTDLSQESRGAATWTNDVAQHLHAAGNPVHVAVAYVTDALVFDLPTARPAFEDPDNRVRMERAVHEWMGHTPDAPLPGNGKLVFREGRASRELAQLAREEHAGLLVVGMTGRGALARAIVGSTAHRLAHHPPCPLAIVHPEHANWSEIARKRTPDGKLQLMVATDFSDHSLKAVALAQRFARLFDAHLHIVTVVVPMRPVAMPNGFVAYTGQEYEDIAIQQSQAQRDMDKLLIDHAPELGHISHQAHILAGYPSREITDFAQSRDISGIFMGTVGRSAMDEFLMGSVAFGVVKHMPCTIVLSPPVATTPAA